MTGSFAVSLFSATAIKKNINHQHRTAAEKAQRCTLRVLAHSRLHSPCEGQVVDVEYNFPGSLLLENRRDFSSLYLSARTAMRGEDVADGDIVEQQAHMIHSQQMKLSHLQSLLEHAMQEVTTPDSRPPQTSPNPKPTTCQACLKTSPFLCRIPST